MDVLQGLIIAYFVLAVIINLILFYLKSFNVNARASFGVGLFFATPLFNFLLGALSIYLGIRALKQIRAESTRGLWLASFGIILGMLPYYFGLLFLLDKYGNLTPLQFFLASVALSAATIIIFTLLLLRFFHGKK